MIDTSAREKRKAIELKKRINNPANSLLNRHTQPNKYEVVNRLGYNTCTSVVSQNNSIGRLSGSSLNRQAAEKRKYELQKLLEGETKITEKVGQTIDEYREYEQDITNLRADIIIKQGNRKRFPITQDKRGNGLHVLSARTRGKVRDKATAFYRACGKTKTFATLTFIQDIDDRTGVAILNKFLTQLRDDYQTIKYMWVAERQGTGRIHFHLIFNQRLPVQHYNALWVLQQYNAGLRFNDISIQEIAQRYKEGTISEILNPFDIEKIHSVYGLSHYLTKYITKNKSEGFTCLAWHCSRSVSKCFTKAIASYSCLRAAQSDVNTRVDYKTGEIKKAGSIHGCFYNLYYIENRPYFLRELSELEQVNKWIIEGMVLDRIPETNDDDIRRFFNN